MLKIRPEFMKNYSMFFDSYIQQDTKCYFQKMLFQCGGDDWRVQQIEIPGVELQAPLTVPEISLQLTATYYCPFCEDDFRIFHILTSVA